MPRVPGTPPLRSTPYGCSGQEFGVKSSWEIVGVVCDGARVGVVCDQEKAPVAR